MNLIITLLVLALESLSTFVYSVSNNFSDQQALLSFKASITDDPLGALSSWNNSIHFCRWNGVACSHKHQRVTALNLSAMHLTGTLSSHIGNLSFLKGIYLRDNDFHGSIPDEIGKLFRLHYLELKYNSFEGGFPANLSHCVDIKYIGMYKNNLRGKLPTEFVYWSKLYHFDLGNNHLDGSIPPSIGNLSSLSYLDLRENNLVGVIPLEIAHLVKLQGLVLATNNFSGMVPLQLYNISSLYTLDLHSNELEGTLPVDLGFTLPELGEFFVGINRFSGPLPLSIANASNLVYFDISTNNITGPVPMYLGGLSNLQVLDLGSNPLGDNQWPDDLIFLNSLVNCTYLYELSLYDNGFKGQLPNSIVNLSTTIETIDLFENQIYGSIPREIGKLVNMTQLTLYENFITGTIPESIGELSKLSKLLLGENNISGVIPNSVGNITQLSVLSFEINMLHGSIPTALFNISTLEGLYLSTSGLGGAIPDQIGRLSSRCAFLNLDRNLFTGPVPSNIGSLKQLVGLDLSYNELTGDIPTTLGDCVMLEELRMQGNLFHGRIPTSFNRLKSLKLLDLSSNNISEDIPKFFDGFHLIEFLNLSHNNLGGEVPREGLFSNISAFSVTGNLGLCGGIQALHLPACPVKDSQNKGNIIPTRIIPLLIVLPIGIFLGCLAIILYRHRKSKQKNGLIMASQDNQHPRVSYQDLRLATNDFSPDNLLGQGRYALVYKGFLESVRQTVAVKVLNVELHGANKSFLTECKTLRDIRHRNLIKIITTCSSTDFEGNDFKALVFEFMTNGSLDNWLHPSLSFHKSERNLTLLQRLNIAIDVALGVDYLHHHSHASIIHCDLKPSNILLDEEFVAHIGDFGLARFYFATSTDTGQAQTSSTGVRGTFGYVPPEYGMGGEISAQGDVYSYGILLLEMFSGKRPTSSTLTDNGNSFHTLYDYVQKALPQRVMEIVDQRILPEREGHDFTANYSYSEGTMEACLISIFEVGILCSNERPRERIDLNVAIKQLHVVREKLCYAGSNLKISVHK